MKSNFSKYLIFLLITFLTVGIIARLYNSSLEKKDLIKVTGNVKFVRHEATGFKPVKHPLYIYLHSGEKYYISDDKPFNTYSDNIEYLIRPGDFVTIYVRSKLQTAIGWGRQNTIMQFEHDGQILLPIEIHHMNDKQTIPFLILLDLILISVSIYKKRKAKLKLSKGLPLTAACLNAGFLLYENSQLLLNFIFV